jgi:hypothetical protein
MAAIASAFGDASCARTARWTVSRCAAWCSPIASAKARLEAILHPLDPGAERRRAARLPPRPTCCWSFPCWSNRAATASAPIGCWSSTARGRADFARHGTQRHCRRRAVRAIMATQASRRRAAGGGRRSGAKRWRPRRLVAASRCTAPAAILNWHAAKRMLGVEVLLQMLQNHRKSRSPRWRQCDHLRISLQ